MLERHEDKADASMHWVSRQLCALIQLAAWAERFGVGR